MTTNDWTPEERAALDRLPREREPGELLEARTVAALRRAGHLAPPGGARRRPSLRVRTFGGWLAAGVAAALACFLGGLAIGQSLGARQAADVVALLRDADAAQAAVAVQRAGSAYIAALAVLGTLADTADAAAVAAGREVAVNAFWAAAGEVARLAPDDPLAAQILQAYETASRPPAGHESGRRHVVWF